MKFLISLSVLLVAALSVQAEDGPAPMSSTIRRLLSRATLYNKQGRRVTLDDLKGKYIGIYFSGHWCAPCRKMTPILSKVWQGENRRFEVIWVTQDHSEGDANDYYNESMPWLRMPYREARSIGRELFNAVRQRYIPTLTMLDPNFNVINYNARSQIESDRSGRRFPWRG